VCSSEVVGPDSSFILASRVEIGNTLMQIRYVYDNVENWSKPEGIPFTMKYFLANPTVRKESKGIVVVIVPFNYPLWNMASPVVSMTLLTGIFFSLKNVRLVPLPPEMLSS
jgi:acyl-CoA reductase-like NAD-dependent aldehyde dehydrogenase